MGQLNVKQSAPKGHYRILSLMLHFLSCVAAASSSRPALPVHLPAMQPDSRTARQQPARLAVCLPPVGFVGLNSLAAVAFSCCTPAGSITTHQSCCSRPRQHVSLNPLAEGGILLSGCSSPLFIVANYWVHIEPRTSWLGPALAALLQLWLGSVLDKYFGFHMLSASL